MEKAGEWIKLDVGSTSEFPHAIYRFTVSWEADTEQSYQEGDYITFTVSIELSGSMVNMVAENGDSLY